MTMPCSARRSPDMCALGYLATIQKRLVGPCSQPKDGRDIHTACTSRVSVLEPSPSDVLVLFIYADLRIGDPLCNPNRGDDSRNPSTDDDDSQGPAFINRSFFNYPFVVCGGSAVWVAAIDTRERAEHTG